MPTLTWVLCTAPTAQPTIPELTPCEQKGEECSSIASPWAEKREKNFPYIHQITPIWSDIAAVPKEMRKHQTTTRFVMSKRGVCSLSFVSNVAIFNSLCVSTLIISWNIPVIFVGYSLFEGENFKGGGSPLAFWSTKALHEAPQQWTGMKLWSSTW